MHRCQRRGHELRYCDRDYFGIVALALLGSAGVEGRSERLSSEPESSPEFVTLAEEDWGYSSPPEFDASEDFFTSTLPVLLVDSHPNDDGDNGVLGPARRPFVTGTLFS